MLLGKLWKIAIATLYAGLALLPFPVLSDTRDCETGNVSVTYQNLDTADMVCRTAALASTLFERCNIPAITEPITIDIVDDVGPGCVGVYHCGEHYIELLSPPVLNDVRDAEGAFGHLPIDAYFQSVVVHELAHAATDDIPCPFDNCVVTAEYIAYVMQVLSLDLDDQQRFADIDGLDGKISSQDLVPIILYMAPDLFAQKSWIHFTQRGDPYGFLGQLVRGERLLDQKAVHRD